MGVHAGWSGSDIFLCPGGNGPKTLRCDCECHSDQEMQKSALEETRRFKEQLVPSKPKRRLKRRVKK